MTHPSTHRVASAVDAEDGLVVVDGPQGLSLALTPDAAGKTGERLIEQAEVARGQAVRPDQPEYGSDEPATS